MAKAESFKDSVELYETPVACNISANALLTPAVCAACVCLVKY